MNLGAFPNNISRVPFPPAKPSTGWVIGSSKCYAQIIGDPNLVYMGTLYMPDGSRILEDPERTRQYDEFYSNPQNP
jgi:hypothetical protein